MGLLASSLWNNVSPLWNVMNYLVTCAQVAQCLLHAHCGWDILFEVLSL